MTLELPANVVVLDRLAADDSGYDIRDRAVLAALSLAEDRHFWHVARNRYIATHLHHLGVRAPSRFLELGCGGGSVAAHLAGIGYQVTGVDGHLPRVIEAAARAPSARFIVHDLRRGVGALETGFDAVGLFDVLEHLDEPAIALRDAASCVRPGGFVVGTVPSLMALWSAVDDRAGHRVRYDRRSLTAVFARVPELHLREIRGFNRTLTPIMWLRRRAVTPAGASAAQSDDLAIPPAPLNWLFRMSYAWSTSASGFWNEHHSPARACGSRSSARQRDVPDRRVRREERRVGGEPIIAPELELELEGHVAMV